MALTTAPEDGNAYGPTRRSPKGMSLSSLWKALSALLFGVGILITELEFYADYASDPSYMINISFDVGMLVAGCAAVVFILLMTGHEVGAGVGATVLGAILTVILLRSGELRYYGPPLLDIAGGLAAVVAFVSEPAHASRPATPPQ